jgi:hypothetical protein
MKNLLPVMLIMLLCCSCENTWDSESKKAYYDSCMEEANNWGTPEQAKAHCDCVLEKTMKKYPSVNDALENMDKIMVDEDLKACKAAALGQ